MKVVHLKEKKKEEESNSLEIFMSNMLTFRFWTILKNNN